MTKYFTRNKMKIFLCLSLLSYSMRMIIVPTLLDIERLINKYKA